MLFIRSQFLGVRTLLLACIAIAFIFADHHHRLVRLRSTLNWVTAPLQYLVELPVDIIHWVEISFSGQHHLRLENLALQEKQLLLDAKLQRLAALEKENQQLHALLGSASKISGKVLVAQLLAVDLAPFTQQVMLDKGKRHGIYLGQPVLDAFGVMGQVIEVGPITSRVMLINDARSAIPIQSQRTGSRAIAAGTGAMDRMSLLYVPATADYKKGDTLVTSGLGQRYPVGYPVGTIFHVDHKVGEQFATVYVQPIAKLNSSRQVLLVWPDQPLQSYHKKDVAIHQFTRQSKTG